MTEPSHPVLRDATVADVPNLLRLYEAAGLDQRGDNDDTRAVAHWAALQRAGAQVLLAEEADGTPLGTLTLFILPLLAHGTTPAALVEDVAVVPASQGRGVGRRLLNEAMARASRAGCYKLALSSNVKRESAHAFYVHLGFEQHGYSFAVPLPGAAPGH